MLVLTALILAVSCKKKIDLNLNNEEFSRLVVEGTITDENKQQIIKLTKTSDYSNPQAPIPASGAIVSVTDGTNTFTFTESPSGVYKSNTNFRGEVGKTYDLSVYFESKEYTSSSTMYPAFMLDSLYALPEYDGYSIYINAQESPVSKQYYLMKTIKNGVLNDTLKNWSFFSDDLINGLYLQDFNIAWLEALPGDTVQIETFSISKEQYEYINTALQTQSTPIPFLGSNPANIKGNISNGAMGFFQVSAVSIKGCIIQ